MSRIAYSVLRIALIVLSIAAIINFGRLGVCEGFKYESHGKRDPFVPLIGQDKNLAGKLADITSPEDLKLEGIALGAGGKNTAIINGEMVREGQKVGEIEIRKISAETVELLIDNKPYNLKLSEEGGLKSEH